MPCRLPLGVSTLVLKSACASSHSTRSCLPLLAAVARHRADRADARGCDRRRAGSAAAPRCSSRVHGLVHQLVPAPPPRAGGGSRRAAAGSDCPGRSDCRGRAPHALRLAALRLRPATRSASGPMEAPRMPAPMSVGAPMRPPRRRHGAHAGHPQARSARLRCRSVPPYRSLGSSRSGTRSICRRAARSSSQQGMQEAQRGVVLEREADRVEDRDVLRHWCGPVPRR